MVNAAPQLVTPSTIPAYIREYVARIEGDHTASEIADRVRAQCEQIFPDQVQAWYDSLHRENWMEAVTKAMSSQRSRVARFMRQASNVQYTDDVALGIIQPLDLAYVVDARNTRRQKRAMVGADCGYIASQYESQTQTTSSLARYWRVLERAVNAAGPGMTLGDVYTNEQIAALYRDIVGGDIAQMNS